MNEDQFFEAFNQIDSKYIDDAKMHTIKRRVPIWLKLLPLMLLIVALLIYYSSGYYVYNEGGNYYIAFRGPRVAIEKYSIEQSNPGFGCILPAAPAFYFDSASSVRTDILTGNFTDVEMTNLRRLFIERGPILIPAWDTLCEPSYTQCAGYQVIWQGDRIKYDLDCNQLAGTARLFLSTEEAMTAFKSQCDQIGTASDSYQLVKSYPDISRNATVYYFANNSGIDYYNVVCEITEEGKIIYVLETYADDPDDNPPRTVEVYGVNNGVYYRLYMDDLKDQPTIQWLSSVYLTPLS